MADRGGRDLGFKGGVPLVENGKIIGAIGVSGAQNPQDGQCANAAAAIVH